MDKVIELVNQKLTTSQTKPLDKIIAEEECTVIINSSPLYKFASSDGLRGEFFK